MGRYAVVYRLGFTPWERYGRAAARSIGALLDREESDRSRPLGRALDLDGNPQPVVARTDSSEMAVTIGADGFSYTRAPEQSDGEFKLGNQL